MAGWPYLQNNNSGPYPPQQVPNYVPYTTPATPQQSGILWVQGEAGAKSYLVGAGQSVLLMDSENQCFYIKSTDASGMPMPLRTFDYTERVQNSVLEHTDYVTREEFDRFVNEMKGVLNESAV